MKINIFRGELSDVSAKKEAMVLRIVENGFSAGLETGTGNHLFCRELSLWTFKSQGVLRFGDFKHYREGEQSPPALNTYTVTDTVIIEASLFENEGGEWIPHQSNTVHAELVMLDPHIRKVMVNDGNGHYSLKVKTPNVYGVFKWVIDYKLPGYTFVHHEQVTPLRPFRHNEYARFIVQAYPYYTAVLSLSVAFFTVTTMLLFHKEK